MTKLQSCHRLRLPLCLSNQRDKLRHHMAMASNAATAEPELGKYPIPISPPYPLVSKEVELQRALSAAARSGAYALAKEDIVYEDEWMVVVNKPSGIYCETLLPALGQGESHPELHLANRLDRDTSGIMVITKAHKVAGKLVKAFTEHKVKKTYLALCIGATPDWKKIRINSGHGRSKHGAWRVYSSTDVGRALPGGSLVKDMTTAFEVLHVDGKGKYAEPTKLEVDEIACIEGEGKSSEKGSIEVCDISEIMVRAYPESGRTHQIRLHCQHLGIPIRGDAKYGGVLEWKGVAYDAHALHAESLVFDHPVTAVRLQLRAPLPEWAFKLFGAVLPNS